MTYNPLHWPAAAFTCTACFRKLIVLKIKKHGAHPLVGSSEQLEEIQFHSPNPHGWRFVDVHETCRIRFWYLFLILLFQWFDCPTSYSMQSWSIWFVLRIGTPRTAIKKNKLKIYIYIHNMYSKPKKVDLVPFPVEPVSTPLEVVKQSKMMPHLPWSLPVDALEIWVDQLQNILWSETLCNKWFTYCMYKFYLLDASRFASDGSV